MHPNDALIARKILSSALKAEAARIRFLRTESRKHRAAARRLRPHRAAAHTAGDWTLARTLGERESDHVALADGLREASVCPSERARCANLALGFLRGRAYREIEATTRTPSWALAALMREVAKKAETPYEVVLAWSLVRPAGEVARAA